MRRITPILLPILATTLILAGAMPVTASIMGNTYYFATDIMTQTIQQDNGAVYTSSVEGEFKVAVLETTQVGGDDAYRYNYEGFTFEITPNFVSMNDTVTFINQKVYFTFVVIDNNHNNKSDFFIISFYPQESHLHPGRSLFVNPVWSTHTADWDSAIDDLEDSPVISNIVESSGEGTFHLQFDVEAEMNHNIFGEMNGTITYKYATSFDDDGVLLNYEESIIENYFNANHTITLSTYRKITRTSGIGGLIVTPDAGVPLIFLGGTTIGSLVVGLVIGKKYL